MLMFIYKLYIWCKHLLKYITHKNFFVLFSVMDEQQLICLQPFAFPIYLTMPSLNFQKLQNLVLNLRQKLPLHSILKMVIAYKTHFTHQHLCGIFSTTGSPRIMGVYHFFIYFQSWQYFIIFHFARDWNAFDSAFLYMLSVVLTIQLGLNA